MYRIMYEHHLNHILLDRVIALGVGLGAFKKAFVAFTINNTLSKSLYTVFQFKFVQ
jgi:hypothetical protein